MRETKSSSADRASRFDVFSYRQLLSMTKLGTLLLRALFARLAGRIFALAIILHTLTRRAPPGLAGLTFAAIAPDWRSGRTVRRVRCR
jgi:hypothetical protein